MKINLVILPFFKNRSIAAERITVHLPTWRGYGGSYRYDILLIRVYCGREIELFVNVLYAVQ